MEFLGSERHKGPLARVRVHPRLSPHHAAWRTSSRRSALPSEPPGELELAVRTDAFWARTQSDAVESVRSGRMEASSGDASRLRLLLEGPRTVESGSGRAMIRRGCGADGNSSPGDASRPNSGTGCGHRRASGLLTPYTGAAWRDDGVPSYRIGVRWVITPRATLGLEGSRGNASGEDGSENAFTLRASVRW